MKEVLDRQIFGHAIKPKRGEFNEPPIVLKEARQNYRELYNREPSEGELKHFIESGEESKYFFEKKRQGILV